MKLEFTTVDVFTDRKFGGNPLAVLSDASSLSTEQMQSIAAEFNLAETTFVLPPKDPAHTAEVRIFTPKAEMPFAGHPNVGTAFVLARAGVCHGRKITGDRLVFEEKAGLVPPTSSASRAPSSRRGWRPRRGSRWAMKPLPETVAEICGLDAGEIETRTHRPVIASCGNNFVFAEVKSRAILAKAAVRTDSPGQARAHGARGRRPSRLPCQGTRRGGPVAHVRAPVRRARGSRDRQRQRRADRPAGAFPARSGPHLLERPSARASTWAGRASWKALPRRRRAASSTPISAAVACRC